MHAFQGRTVDRVIATMEGNHPHLTTQKALYMEMSRGCYRAELVTDDRNALCERLEAVTRERISALEAMQPERDRMAEEGLERTAERDRGPSKPDRPAPIPEPASQQRDKRPEPERKSGRGLNWNSSFNGLKSLRFYGDKPSCLQVFNL